MASKKEIDITAKIANLQKIRDELSKIKANIKVDSKDLTEIMKLAKKGLTIPVKFDVQMPKALKDLMSLQNKGITIRAQGSSSSGSGTKPTSQQVLNNNEVARLNQAFANAERDRKAMVDRQLKMLFAQQAQQFKQMQSLDGGFSPLVNGVRPGSTSSINPAFALRRQKEQEKIARIQQKMIDNLEKANDFVRNNPLEAMLGQDVRSIASKKFNVSRSSITSRPNFFDPKRVFKGDNFKDILYTSLLGGPIQGAGAALGAATFDKGGTLIGANVAAAAQAIFLKIADAMKKTVEAGAQYERTVTGITGIFQATSQVIGQDGAPVGIRQALGFQRNRAEGIQAAAQRALLPLGISGDAASALTKSFTAGLAQRGIAPDEKTTETVVRRFGAAINTLQPELANDANALQRTVEDIIGGSPQATRTELGSAIKGLAPNLFTGGAKSNEDIVKATDSLEQLVIAIKNNDTASVQWQRALGSLQLAQQEIGKGILEGIAPAVKSLADELTRPEMVQGLQELGKAIGQAAGDIVNVLVPAIKEITKAAKGGAETTAGLGRATFQGGKAVTSFAAGDFEGVSSGVEGSLTEFSNLLTRRRINITGGRSNPVLDQLRSPVNSAQVSELGNAFAGVAGLRGGSSNLSTRPSLNSLFSSAKTNFDIEDPSIFVQQLGKGPENSLRGLQNLRAKLRDYDAGRSPKDLLEQSIGLNSQEIGFRRQVQQNKNELFDDSESGQLSRALSEKGSLRDVLKLAEENVSKRKQLLTVVSTSTDGQIKDEEAVAKARQGIRQAEEEVIKIRKEVLAKEREIAEKRVSLLRRAAAAEDSGTVQGRFAGLAKEGQANATEKRLIDERISEAQKILADPTASAQAKANARNTITEENINSVANASKDADRQRRQQKEQFSKDTSGLRNSLRTGAFQDSQRSADISLKQLDISTRELAIEQEKLAAATKNANKALTDFADQSRLRELGRQGAELAAAEEIVAAGGTVPGGVDSSLVRGSDSFDPAARAEFERQLAEEKFGSVKRQNEVDRSNDGAFGETAKGLGRNARELALEKERQDLKPEEFEIQKRAIQRSKASNALGEEEAALAEYQNDPSNPELRANYFRAREAREAIEKAGAAIPSPGEGAGARIKKKMGTFSINGEPVVPGSSAAGMNISSGLAPDLIASNDIGGAILQGISGSAYGKARETTDGAKAIGEGILKGLGADRDTPVNNKEVNGGASIFDKLEAKLPSKQDMQDAFSAALQQNFA